MPAAEAAPSVPPAAEAKLYDAHEQGSLLARPAQTNVRPSRSGKIALGLGARRDGFVYVPASLGKGPRPLVVFLHGSGGDANHAEPLFGPAEKHRVLILSIDSRAATWDLIVGDVGPDTAFLDSALRLTFKRCAVDDTRVALSGFSDGASYALSLGLANGALFSHVLAFSPGFSSPPHRSASPKVFVSHGRSDCVLPIDACSRTIVRNLRRKGYAVEYREFDGGHVMPPQISSDAFTWMLEAQAG